MVRDPGPAFIVRGNGHARQWKAGIAPRESAKTQRPVKIIDSRMIARRDRNVGGTGRRRAFNDFDDSNGFNAPGGRGMEGRGMEGRGIGGRGIGE
jgi:hypothetical protein